MYAMREVIPVVSISLEIFHRLLILAYEHTPKLRYFLESLLIGEIRIVVIDWVEVVISHGRDYWRVREISMKQLRQLINCL